MPLKSLLGRFFPAPVAFPDPAPDAPFVAVGDIHGRADLLETILHRHSGTPMVCVGDYVDRGDNSAEVLNLLMERPNTVCLRGNHEAMMLAFLEDPELFGPRWMRFGGLQTLASFGISGISETTQGRDLIEAAEELAEAMGKPMIDWIRTRPLMHRSGNIAVVHAGADPALAIDAQPENALLWGHRDFARVRRTDGIWVVHGHTIVPEPVCADGRIAIDTGAYATGRLTAAHIAPGGVTFTAI